jgi:hypothetical protein
METAQSASFVKGRRRVLALIGAYYLIRGELRPMWVNGVIAEEHSTDCSPET